MHINWYEILFINVHEALRYIFLHYLRKKTCGALVQINFSLIWGEMYLFHSPPPLEHSMDALHQSIDYLTIYTKHYHPQSYASPVICIYTALSWYCWPLTRAFPKEKNAVLSRFNLSTFMETDSLCMCSHGNQLICQGHYPATQISYQRK